MARTAHERGSFVRARELYERARRWHDQSDPALEVLAAVEEAVLLVELGQADEARSRFDALLTRRSVKRRPYLEARAMLGLAVLTAQAGEVSVARSRLTQARQLAAAAGDTRLIACLEALSAILAGERVELQSVAWPSPVEARLAQALATAMVPRAATERGRAIALNADAGWFEFEGVRHVLGHRPTVWRVFLRLMDARQTMPGVGVPWQTLAQAGWPGESPRGDSGFARVRTTIRTLRKFGLSDVIQHSADGYSIKSNIVVEHLRSSERLEQDAPPLAPPNSKDGVRES
jgi:hypothetical protein